MDWILFNSNHCRVTETASSNINSGLQRKFEHIHGRWNYFFFFPRVSFWMPCDFTVRAPSWTGWLTHFVSISCVQFCLPGSGIYFVTLVFHRWNSGEFVFATGLFIFFRTVFSWPAVYFVRKAPFSDNQICSYYVNSIFCTPYLFLSIKATSA